MQLKTCSTQTTQKQELTDWHDFFLQADRWMDGLAKRLEQIKSQSPCGKNERALAD